MLVKRTFRWIASLLAIGLVACRISYADIPDELETAVTNYYKAEMGSNWALVYSYRNNGFQQHVSENDFIAAMKEFSKGWSLKAFTIVGAEESEKGVYKIRMSFTEEPPTEFWAGSGLKPNDSIKIDDTAIWVKDVNTWKCRHAPARGHLPFSE